jgi:putative sigma-54 modulation protein
VQIAISTRHGALEPEQQRYLHDKAEKLLKYFDRLMSIEVAVDHGKHGWEIEILVSAEHKHDFVAREGGSSPEAAMDLCVHKIEQQLRRYKEKVQHHKGEVTHGGPFPRLSEDSQAGEAAETDPDEV